jgi:hypothetical protein
MTGAQETPIALFVFKRPQHTSRTLKALAENPEFFRLPLVVFCDNARSEHEKLLVDETRQIVRAFPHPNKTLVEREQNTGLAASIIDGVGQLCDRYGRVIVLEDDLAVSDSFLAFMLRMLDRYENFPQVMQISGHAFNVDGFRETDAVLFLPFISSWGWATWSRAWSCFDDRAEGWQVLLSDRKLSRAFDIDGAYPYSAMLASQMEGRIDSWAIRWNWSVFRMNGCTVYPPVSLVANTGFDGTGTHRSTNAQFERQPVGSGRSVVATDPPLTPDRKDPRYGLVRAAIKVMQGSALKQFAKWLQWGYRRARLVSLLSREER